jgi:hypothetical protein
MFLEVPGGGNDTRAASHVVCRLERSVNTVWVADRFVDALAAEPHIAFRPGTFVVAAESIANSWSGPWKIRCEPEVDDQFDFVVNGGWQLTCRSGLCRRPNGLIGFAFRYS